MFVCFDFSTRHIWQTFNALFIIRCLVKYIIEIGSEFQLLQHFEAIPSTTNPTSTNSDEQHGVQVVKPIPTIVHVDGSKFESFFDAVVNIIVVIPVKYVSPYLIYFKK